MTPSSSLSRSESSVIEEDENQAHPSGVGRMARFIPIILLVSILVGAVYAGFVATHTFTYPGTSAPITTKTCTVNFTANIAIATLATCANSGSDFNVAGTGPVTVLATSSLGGGSGVTLTEIQAAPLSVPCTVNPPTAGTGVVTIPMPGTGSASVTFSGGIEYDYCIYYTSAVTITAGSFSVTYSA